MIKLLPLCLVVMAGLCSSTVAQEIHVAAASDLTVAMPVLAQQFEKQTRCKVVVSFGSSGNFYQQLQNGAPFDVFLSADTQYPQNLQDAGLTAPGTYREYASGKIVLWVRGESKLDLSQGLKALTNEMVKKVAIANPQHAPYGTAAASALKVEGIYDQVSSKLVLGENISQAALFVQSGNADAGIIAYSLALSPAMKSAGRFVEVPATEYRQIRQAAVVMKNTKNAEGAKQFVEFLGSDSARRTLQLNGFSTN